MKKGLRLLKRMAALFLVLLLSIESFGAVVSDNDGSAFITKAEFDSLKNDFQSQIDQYNTSIDAKIDGAIAAYLAGIKTSVRNTSSLILKNWETVNFLGGVVDPTFAYPTLSHKIGASMYSWVTNTSSNKNNKMLSFITNIFYDKTWNSNEYCLRPLVNVTGTEADHKEYIWNGIANRYVERIATSTLRRYNFGDFAYMNNGNSYFRFNVIDVCLFKGEGYNSGIWSDTDFWKGDFKYQYRANTSATSWYTTSTDPSNKYTNTVLQVELQEVDEKTKQYEHIIEYDKSKKWHVSNETFSKTLRRCSKNTLTSKKFGEAASKNNISNFMAVSWNNSNYYSGNHGTLSNNYQYDTEQKIPSIGYIGEIESTKIYQFKDDIDITFNSKTQTLEKMEIYCGWPIHPVQKGTTLDWQCEFDKVINTKSDDTKEENKREIDIYFSYGKFSDTIETNNKIKVTDMSDGKEYDTITTKDRKARIKFESDRDSIVYVKCVPHFEASESALIEKFWDVQLNVKKSSNIGYVIGDN